MSGLLALLLALLLGLALALWGLHSAGSRGRGRRLAERFAAHSLPHARVRMTSRVAWRAPQATPRQRHNLALAHAAADDAPRAAELLAPELGEDSREAVLAWRAALAGS